MSDPPVICGARTWVAPDESVSCNRERGHNDKHTATASFGLVGWREPACRFVVGSTEHVWKIAETRALVASLQRQLDALDPGVAIAEAEQRMNEAWSRQESIGEQAAHSRHGDHSEALVAASNEAFTTWQARVAEWFEFVQARAATPPHDLPKKDGAG